MEIHFYENADRCSSGVVLHCDWTGTEAAIESKQEDVHTTQMGLLSTSYLIMGHRVFIHPSIGEPYEITLRPHGSDKDRMVRPAQAMFGMWRSGVFSK